MLRKSLWLLLCVIILAGCRVVPENILPTDQEEAVPTFSDPIVVETVLPVLVTATAIPTLEPTAAVLPTETPVPVIVPTEAPREVTPPPVSIQTGGGLAAPAFLHADLGCSWMGVAGQVFGTQGQPLQNLVLSVEGNIGGQTVKELGFAGLATGYGPGGYEIKLAGSAVPGIFWITVFDLAGNLLSEPQLFTTSGACDQNLVILNFSSSMDSYTMMLPVVTR